MMRLVFSYLNADIYVKLRVISYILTYIKKLNQNKVDLSLKENPKGL